MPIGLRDGRVGILATLVLLVSLVLFIGCLFWLSVNGPWSGGSLFGNNLFKPATYSNQDDETVITVVEIEMNITAAIDDLIEAGCVFIEYTKEYNDVDTIQLDYLQFKEEAINRKLVYRTQNSQETPVLLVMKNGKVYGWTP